MDVAALRDVPTCLRVEHLDVPLGITERTPRLSWRLPSGARRQLAYRIRTSRWHSGRVESDASVLVPYDGPPLHSGERVTWTVKVWTDRGESEWAQPAWWEMGLLTPEDWIARWIEPAESAEVRAKSPHPAYLIRPRAPFRVVAPVAKARLYVTAHGVYEAYINDRRVGDAELTPGPSSCWHHLHVQAFDVTELIEPGENVLGAIVSDGWFRGQNSGLRVSGVYGDSVALLAQLHVHSADGAVAKVATGPDWVAAAGAIEAADLMEGQTTDLRRRIDGWCTARANGGWDSVTMHDYDLTRLRSSPSPPVRRTEELRPRAVTSPSPDRQVIDIGQNINGWIRLHDLGPRGTTLTLTHGEVLDTAGDVTLVNIVSEVEESVAASLRDLPWRFSLGSPFQVDRVISAGTAGQCFEPRHTTHGFRYVRVEGHPGTLSPDDATGVVVHTDLRRTGWFECSDERINRLHEAAVWSFRGNACHVPTDCPTRERLGWTGDWQVFVSTAAFLFDVAGFTTKWLEDLAADQRPDGVVEHCAPEPVPPEVSELLGHPPGSAGFGDAAVIVPWEIYCAYADRQLLEQQWPSMTAWVEHAARAAREGRHPTRVAARPRPARHEAFIWDTGFHWGEWLQPGDAGNPAEDAAADNGDVATAYLHYSSRLLAEIAAVLGRDAAAARYKDLAAAARAAWQAEFIRVDGYLKRDTQASYVRALAFDLVPRGLRAQSARRLTELIRGAGTHPGTGFLATPYLLPVLADTGHLDLAYQLLFQDTEPSWLTMIDRGATTVWESWNGIDDRGLPGAPPGVGSLNHYSKGAVISFLHRYVAGIRLHVDSPAYRRFEIKPRPGPGITSAGAAHDSPYGRIESRWWIEDERFSLHVVVPAGTSARISLPDGQVIEAHPGSATYRCTTRELRPDRSLHAKPTERMRA